MSNITDLPRRDLIEEIKGPENLGNAVIMHGRVIPHLTMHDRRPGRDEIEFCLGNRAMFGFPCAQAWDAVAFAFAAMAMGADCDPLNFEPRPFAGKAAKIGE